MLKWALVPCISLTALVHLTWLGGLAWTMATRLHMNDFGKIYFSARRLLDGADAPYASSPATSIPIKEDSETRERTYKQFWNLNPPHLHLLLYPLSLVDLQPAYWIWAAASVLAFLLSIRLILGALHVRLRPLGLASVVLGTLAFSGTSAVVVTGQMSWLLMLAVTWVWLEARRGRWTTAALALGALGSVKPFLLLLAVSLLPARRFKETGLAALMVAACFAAGLAVFGVEAHEAWIERVLSVDWHWASMNGSVMGLLSRILRPTPQLVPLMNAPDLARWLGVALSGSIVVVSLLAARPGGDPASVDRCFLVLLLAAQLACPLGWIYNLWLAAGPLLACRCHEQRGPARAAFWIGLALLFVPIPVPLLWDSSPVASLTIGSSYTWATLLLWLAALRVPAAKSPACAVARTIEE